jgi:hypothetical protein
MRTYIRTLFNDIFKNNFLVKTFTSIVNFYFKSYFANPESIKFSPNMPIKDLREKKSFSFQSVTGDKIDCK